MPRARSNPFPGSSPRSAAPATPRRRRAVSLLRRSRRRIGFGTFVLALLLAPAGGISVARADEASTIIERCAHGQSLAGFKRSAYAKALHELPTDVREYSDCEELIRKAALAAAGGGAGPGGGAATAPPTPAEQETLTRAAHARPTPIKVGGHSELPGVVPVSLASALNALPTPLMALLAALLALGAAAGTTSLRGRLPALPFRLRGSK
jgi:hypothetical protein